MNGDHFAEWFQHKLLPNLPAGAAVVMGNAPCHTVKTKESWSPTSKTLKADMQVWLTERNISWKADMLKSELYELVKKSLKMSATAWLWNKVLLSFVCLRTTVFLIP